MGTPSPDTCQCHVTLTMVVGMSERADLIFFACKRFHNDRY